MRVLGVDPGLANFGWAVLDGNSIHLGCITSTKSHKKRGVLVADDNLRRARELAAELTMLLDAWKPQVVCCESMSHPRQASNAGKLSMAWGVLAALLFARSLPVAMASPQEIKKAVTGKRDASKDEVQAALAMKWPGLTHKLSLFPKARREHPTDALAAIVACEGSDIVRACRQPRGVTV